METEFRSRFKRGDVYVNSNYELTMVKAVLYKGDDFKIEYITENGETGHFYESNVEITNNIKRHV